MKKLLFLLCLPTLLTAMEGSQMSPIKKQRIDQTEQKLNNPRSLASLATQALGGISQIKDQETRNAHYQATIDLLCNSNLPNDQAVQMLYQLPKEVVSENKELLEDWFNAAFKHDEKSKKDLEYILKMINEPKEKERIYYHGDGFVPKMDPNGSFIVKDGEYDFNNGVKIVRIGDPEDGQQLTNDGLEQDQSPKSAFNAQGDYFLITDPVRLFKYEGNQWVETFELLNNEYRGLPTDRVYNKASVEEKIKKIISIDGCEDEDLPSFASVYFSPCSNYFLLATQNSMEQSFMLFDIKGNLLFVEDECGSVSWSKSGEFFTYKKLSEDEKDYVIVLVKMDNKEKRVANTYEFRGATIGAIAPDESYIVLGYEDGAIKAFALNCLQCSPVSISNGEKKIGRIVFSSDGKFFVVQARDTVTIYSSTKLILDEPGESRGNNSEPVTYSGIKCERLIFNISDNNFLAVAFPDCVKVFCLDNDLHNPVATLDHPNVEQVYFLGNFLFISTREASMEEGDSILFRLNEGNSFQECHRFKKVVRGCGCKTPQVSKDGRYMLTDQDHRSYYYRLGEQPHNEPHRVAILWNYGISKQSFYNLDVQERALIIELVNLQRAGKTWPEEWEFPQNAFDHLPEAAKDRLKDVVSKPIEEADVDAPPIKNGKEEE